MYFVQNKKRMYQRTNGDTFEVSLSFSKLFKQISLTTLTKNQSILLGSLFVVSCFTKHLIHSFCPFVQWVCFTSCTTSLSCFLSINNCSFFSNNSFQLSLCNFHSILLNGKRAAVKDTPPMLSVWTNSPRLDDVHVQTSYSSVEV